MSEPLRVAVLQGGRSLERAVSLRSGAQVRDGLGRLGHTAIPIDAGGELVGELIAAQPDVAFIALHGRHGEDGTIQEVLEALQIPYTGSGPAACVRATDKVLAKHLMRAAGIPTPPFFALHDHVVKQLGGADALPSIEERLGFPMVVKPAHGGSALGVKFARQGSELPGAMVGAFSYDVRLLLERHIA